MSVDESKGFIITEGTEHEEPEKHEPEMTESAEKPTKRIDPEKATVFSNARRINKRAITLVLMGTLGAIVVLGSLLRTDSEKKKMKQNSRAPDVVVPDFGDYQSRSYNPEPMEVGALIPESDLPVVAPPIIPVTTRNLVEQKPAVMATTRRAYTESELAAMGSSLFPEVEGVLIGRNPEKKNMFQDMPMVNTFLTPDDYYQQRYSALAQSLPAIKGNTDALSVQDVAVNKDYDQNMQKDKKDFANTGRKEPSGGLIPESTVWKGTIIPGVLITAINTDLPGDLQARVTENIYDSLTGKKLLIPQGTIMIAAYNSSVSFAQERVQIAWNTLIRPDGYEISLGNMNGVDAKGFSGVKGNVDDHIFQYVKAAGVISAFTILNGEISYSTGATTNPALQNLIAENQAVVNKISAKIIDRTLDIQPTLRVKSGTKINIMVNNNLMIPPLNDYQVVKKYKRY